MGWLADNDTTSPKQYRSPRRETVSGGIVVHTSENTPDYVAFDGGAEAVARFIATRKNYGSYHDLTDSDSCITLVNYDDEAFHVARDKVNHYSLSLSIATRADVWPLAPKAWQNGAIEQAAQAATRQAKWVETTTGITVPAKRITATEFRARRPGFCAHGDLDPGRRHDPGDKFPWDQFLNRFAQLTAIPAPNKDDNKDNDMSQIKPYSIRVSGPSVGRVKTGSVWVIDPLALTAWRPTGKDLQSWRKQLDGMYFLQMVDNREDKQLPTEFIARLRLV
ncbi:hypothetical protein [Mycobacterium sp.]|uniref:hypothetical protein n=1 Tax=Mycobacterium sp. TaxID=1785 RepID=UPI003A843954